MYVVFEPTAAIGVVWVVVFFGGLRSGSRTSK